MLFYNINLILMSKKSPKRKLSGKKRIPRRTSHNFIKIFGILAAIIVGMFALFNFQQTGMVLSDVSTEIVGGSKVRSGKYPFMVALLDRTVKGNAFAKQFCGGSLISSQHVLTAAHCAEDYTADITDLNILIGRTVLTGRGGEIRRVKEIHIYPEYWWDSDADIAVLTLDKPVSNRPPIALAGPQDDVLETPGTELTVTGWGSVTDEVKKNRRKKGKNKKNTKNNTKPVYSKELREVKIPVKDDEACYQAYDEIRTKDIVICAGTGRRDSCWADSGGPLFSQVAGRGFVQVGIVSGGFKCGHPTIPGYYTEVNNPEILNFINRVINDMNTGPTPPSSLNGIYTPPTLPAQTNAPYNSSYNSPYQGKN